MISLEGKVKSFSYKKEDGYWYIKQDLFLNDRFMFGIEYGPLSPEVIKLVLAYHTLEDPENVEAVAEELMPELEEGVKTIFKSKIDELRRNVFEERPFDFKAVKYWMEHPTPEIQGKQDIKLDHFPTIKL